MEAEPPAVTEVHLQFEWLPGIADGQEFLQNVLLCNVYFSSVLALFLGVACGHCEFLAVPIYTHAKKLK